MPETPKSFRAVWIGRTLSALVVAALLVDGATQLLTPAKIASMMQDTGFPMILTPVLGWVMLVCAALYAIPVTTVLGAILVTGFLGGAICAHVRLGEIGSPPELLSLLLGVMAWGGLYLRDPRIRGVLPLSRSRG